MKTVKAVTVACWIIAAAALIGLAIWFLTGTIFGVRLSNKDSESRWSGLFSGISGISFSSEEMLSGPFEVVGTYEVGIADIKSLNVDWVAGNVRVEPYDGAAIKITEYAQRALKDNEKLYYATSGSALNIRFREQTLNMGRVPQKKLEVLVPRELCGSFDDFRIDSVSGGISADNIGANGFKAESMSGSINLANIATATFTINSTSGSVKVSEVQTDHANIESTSGSIEATSLRSGDIKIESVSGSVRVSESSAGSIESETASGSINIAGDFESMKTNSVSGRVAVDNAALCSAIDAETMSGSIELSGSFDRVGVASVSGSVNIRSAVVPASAKVETMSGSVTIAVPDGDSITVDHSSISGGFSSDVPVVMQSSGAQFSISTVSGRTRIVKI